MKTKIISSFLLLAMLTGLFGCTGILAPPYGGTPEQSQSPATLLSDVGNPLIGTPLREGFINLAATDENGDPLYRIVHKMGAESYLTEQCKLLASAIYDTTGITVPVVHEMEDASPYEILVGDVIRAELIDVKDSLTKLDSNTFQILTVNSRVWIYGKNDQTVVSGLILLTNQLAQRDPIAKSFGVPADFEYLYQPVDKPTVSVSKTEECYVELNVQNATALSTYARLSYTGNSGWRIQTKYYESGTYNDFGAAQRLAYSLGEADPSAVPSPLKTTRQGNIFTATGPDGSRVEMQTDSFLMNFYTPSGKLAATLTNISANPAGSSITGALLEGEAIFGTGERFNSVNQRGQLIEMFTKDLWSRADACYMAIPLLCSSRGSGVFINLYEHMFLDIGKSKANEWQASITGAQMDAYVYTTETIPEVIQGYSELTGYAAMPEEWTYGMLVCSIAPEFSQKWSADITPSADGRGEGIYEMIANMESHDLPWTGVLAEGWGPYHANKHKDLKELCDYVHSLGKKFLVYMRVGSVPTGTLTDQSLTNKAVSPYTESYLLTQNANGIVSHNLPSTTPHTNNPDVGVGTQTYTYLDITNPEATSWFFDEYWDYLTNDIGVDGCKIDFCELLPENYKLNYFDQNMPTAGSHHWYPTAFCSMFYEMVSAKPDSGMCYSRGGGIGSQRSPYMWAGDQMRYWAGIQYQLKAVLSSGLSGVPYMSYDMSGYQNGGNPQYMRIDYEAPVFLRGTQYSAFTICIQTHGRGIKRSYQFAKEYPMLDKSGNTVLDENGAPIMVDYTYVTEIYRAYTKLHEHLTPYITELCEEASQTGMPAMRHMILEYANDPNVYTIEDAYMFGDAFLIAPILNDQSSRNIYLPKGTWIDLNTGEQHVVAVGGTWLNDYPADLSTLPSFFNVETESQIAPTLVEGITELYSYARSLLPEQQSSSVQRS